jgi:caffeoyl-CoA O-methyltransferase
VFRDIPEQVLSRMRELEAIDARDRLDGTARLRRLRQVPPDTGRFIALLAATAPSGRWIEVGTSAWLRRGRNQPSCRRSALEQRRLSAHR